jgi:hypothetical protein
MEGFDLGEMALVHFSTLRVQGVWGFESLVFRQTFWRCVVGELTRHGTDASKPTTVAHD